MVVLRQANDADRAIITEISKHYDSNLVRLVYTSWQQQGHMYMAELEGKTIGFCCLAFPAPTEAQILGIRLLPEFRKESIGQRFVIALIQAAQERGCNIVRTLTSSENWETQAALQRNLGFQRGGTWVIGHQERLRSKINTGAVIQPSSPDRLEDIWQFLQYSSTYRLNEGLIFSGGYFFRNFSKAYLAQLLQHGQVFASLEREMITGVAVSHCEGETLVISYVDANPSSILDLLQGMLGCALCNCRQLTTAIPSVCYQSVRPFLEQIVEKHLPDKWLVMEKEVSPLALPRD